MLRTHPLRRGRTPRLLAVAAGVLLAATVGFYADAAPTTKPYTATWLNGSTPVNNPPNTLAVAGTATSVKLQLKNWASQQVLGSANITPPAGYTLGAGSTLSGAGTATAVAGTLQLRGLNVAPGGTVDVTIAISVGCGASTSAATWALRVKQSNDFSGPPGNDFSLKSGTAAPSTTASGGNCALRFATTPGTTQTGQTIRSGFGSSGDPIKVEIYDPATNAVVASSAAVTLTVYSGSAGATLSGGGPVNAVNGVATFSSLSLDLAGAYRLQASSPAASNSPITPLFMVGDTVATCSGVGCTFTETQNQNSYLTDPETGTAGSQYAAALNLPGLRISCEFDPYNYPDSRQPNSVWYVYDDGSVASGKTISITIDKKIVQQTAENGASFYRVCYTSPIPFTDRNGNAAPADPWSDGPSAYFGTTWYTGLLPDCSAVNDVAPCVVSWTGTNGGDRLGVFKAPPGDPGYR